MLCQDCPKKDSCVELCKKAEKYVNQDHVLQREKTIGLPKYGKLPDLVSNVYLTKIEQQIVTLSGLGLSRKEICQVMNISRGNLRLVIHRVKKKL